jgi:hypothetical protein
MLKDHSTPDSPPQEKAPNFKKKKKTFVNNRELLIPTLCADLLVSQVNLLPHEPSHWPMKERILDIGSV